VINNKALVFAGALPGRQLVKAIQTEILEACRTEETSDGDAFLQVQHRVSNNIPNVCQTIDDPCSPAHRLQDEFQGRWPVALKHRSRKCVQVIG
jgi:hypothetical protein